METLEDVIKRMYGTPIVTKFESDLLFCIKEMETEIERLHDLHLERTKLTTKVITERDQAEAKIEKLNAIVQPLTDVRQSYHRWLRPLEEIYFKKLMEIMDNNQSKTSEMAGLNRGTVRKKLKQYNLIQG